MKKLFFSAAVIGAAALALSACGSSDKAEEAADSANTVVNDTVNAAVKGNVTANTPDSDIVYSVDVENATEKVVDGKVEVQTEETMTPEGAQ